MTTADAFERFLNESWRKSTKNGKIKVVFMQYINEIMITS